MRESIESKPNTNGTSRDAISPDVSFQNKTTTLSDGSLVYDVIIWTVENPQRMFIAAMPSERTAGQCADMLQRVLGRFLRCGSDRDAVNLAIKIEDALK